MEKQYKNFPFTIPKEEKSGVNISNGIIAKKTTNMVNMGRPTIITVLCGYFFVSWCLKTVSWLVIFLQTSGKISFNFSGIGQLSFWVGLIVSTFIIISIFGYWLMRKWGVYLYTAVIVFNFVYLLFRLGSFPMILFLGFLLPIVVIIVGFLHLEKMY